jgi:hypothetical protein
MGLPFFVWLFIKRPAWPAFLEKHQPRNGPRVLATSSFDCSCEQKLAAPMDSKFTLSELGFLTSQQAKAIRIFTAEAVPICSKSPIKKPNPRPNYQAAR